jgi:hypothetical protein
MHQRRRGPPVRGQHVSALQTPARPPRPLALRQPDVGGGGTLPGLCAPSQCGHRDARHGRDRGDHRRWRIRGRRSHGAGAFWQDTLKIAQLEPGVIRAEMRASESAGIAIRCMRGSPVCDPRPAPQTLGSGRRVGPLPAVRGHARPTRSMRHNPPPDRQKLPATGTGRYARGVSARRAGAHTWPRDHRRGMGGAPVPCVHLSCTRHLHRRYGYGSQERRAPIAPGTTAGERGTTSPRLNTCPDGADRVRVHA